LKNDLFQNTDAESETFVINFDNDVDDLDQCINVDEINLAVKNERL